MTRARSVFATLVFLLPALGSYARADDGATPTEAAAAPTVPATFPAARLAWLPLTPVAGSIS